MTDGPSEPRTLGGRYQLGELIGRGGMAEVHIGRDLRLGRTVAIKLLRIDLARDPSFQARFRREAQSAAALNHPNIVAVYDTGEEPMPDGTGVGPYIVMEYVQGETLRDVLRSGGRLLPERSLEITEGLLAALDYSHRHGIIHRDVKPGNVMLTPAGQVKVMDFGIARAVADSAATMTQTSAVLGTAQYLSPEQARGETVDSRSDVYSAGCLLYELLTGRPPFTGDSPVSVAYQHVREYAVPPSQLDAEIPPAYDAVVMKSLAKDPAERYQTAAEMAADLERARTGRPIAAAAVGVAGAAALGVAATSAIPGMDATQQITPVAPPLAYQEDEPPSRMAWYVLLGIATVAVLAGAAWLAASIFGGSGGTKVLVPDLTGLTKAQAAVALERVGLTLDPTINTQVSDKPKNTVIAQDPDPQAEAPPNSAVVITVSGGPANVTVPVVVGMTQAAAQQAIQDAGLSLGPVTKVDDRDEDKGTVIDSNPSTGTAVAPGTRVALSVASGLVKVPDVTGLNISDATTQLANAGFETSKQSKEDATRAPGEVISTNPAGGTELARGKTVNIVYAKAPPPPPSSSAPPPSSSAPPPSSSAPPPSSPGTSASP